MPTSFALFEIGHIRSIAFTKTTDVEGSFSMNCRIQYVNWPWNIEREVAYVENNNRLGTKITKTQRNPQNLM